jgi:di/tricarboxylate transporter
LGSPEPQNLIKWNFMLETIPNFLFIIGVAFIILLLILWFLLPFAVFGTKVKLNDLINETKKTNDKLEKLRALFVIMIKLQKDSKHLTKKSKSED